MERVTGGSGRAAHLVTFICRGSARVSAAMPAPLLSATVTHRTSARPPLSPAQHKTNVITDHTRMYPPKVEQAVGLWAWSGMQCLSLKLRSPN